MKVSQEKNLAFADQPKPMTYSEVTKIKPAKPKSTVKAMPIELELNLSDKGDSKIDIIKTNNNRQVLKVSNFKPGTYVFGPDMVQKEVQSLGNKSATFNKALTSDSFLPTHLGLSASPKAETLRFNNFINALPDKLKKGNPATTIFGADNRRVFRDTRYPWGCCGRVTSPNGQGSGVMVGPRHILTASHMVQWNSNGTTGWLKFVPGYYNGAEPFGHAYGVLTYYKYKVNGPTINWIEEMYDYVCVVLNWNIGNLTGWMGSKGYTDAWDGGNYWSHVGYPGDITGGQRPTFQNNFSLDGKWYEFDSHEAMDHFADVWPGQSGGPIFGWWSGWPYVVALQSNHSPGQNDASGGQDMVDFVIRARREHP